MNIQIRRKVFETNSSSIHAISVVKNNKHYVLPEKLNIKLDFFGCEEDLLCTPEKKASYLFSGILGLESALTNERDVSKVISKSKRINSILEILLENKIDFEIITKDEDNEPLFFGIDHNSYDMEQFYDSISFNQKRLLRYLFDEESFVSTGNDNDDSVLILGKTKTHDIYEKGN